MRSRLQVPPRNKHGVFNKKTGSENPERLGLTGIRNGLLIHCQPTVSGVHTDKSRLISNRKSDGIFAYYLILEDIP